MRPLFIFSVLVIIWLKIDVEARCVDKSNECRSWSSNGFCKFYDSAMKASLCPVTCGMCSYKPPPSTSRPVTHKSVTQNPVSQSVTEKNSDLVNAVLEITSDLGKLDGNLVEISQDIDKLIQEIDKTTAGPTQNETDSLSDEFKEIKFIKTFAKGGLVASIAVDLGLDTIDAVSESFEKGGKTGGFKTYIGKTSEDFDSFMYSLNHTSKNLRDIVKFFTVLPGTGPRPNLVVSVVSTFEDVVKGANALDSMKEHFQKAVAHAFVDGLIDLAEIVGGKSLRKFKTDTATIEGAKTKFGIAMSGIKTIRSLVGDLRKGSFIKAVDELSQLAHTMPKILG